MNAECATLHLMSMGVPPETAARIARWVQDTKLCLIYSKDPKLTQIDKATQEMSHYYMASKPPLGDYWEQVVWDPRTGFNPEFRHPETSLT